MIIGIDAHNLEGNRTGVGRYLFNLLKVWTAADFRPSVTITSPRPSPGEGEGEKIKFILYFKDEIPADIPQSILFESKLLKVASTAKFVHWDLARAAKKDKVDVLFCPGYVAPVCYKGKIALALHDIIYEARPDWFNWKRSADKILLKWVSKKAAQKAAVIFTCSNFSKQEIIRCYGVPPQKIAVIYLAADFPLDIAGEEKISEVRRRYGINDRFIFYAGSIFSRRHLPEVIEAFSRLTAEKSDWQLLLSGKNYTRPFVDIDALIKSKNEQLGRPAIVRVDFVADLELRLLYSACAFFIWLSDYEGFGLPPLEAMSAGAPVITSDSTSLKEVAGNVALLIKNNPDVDEIYRAMKKLANDENLRTELSRKGRKQAKKFSWERCAEITIDKILSNN